MADNAFTELCSPRLILRRLRRDDLAALCAYRSLPEVARYQSWESFGPDEAARLIDGQAGLEPNVPGTWFQLAIVVAATGLLVGDCGLHCRQDEPRQMDLGITLAPAHQGRGYASEAIECLLDFVFGRLGKHRVAAVTDADNHPAAALFRRLGFRQEAHFIEHVWFKGAWGSEFVFALLRREWEQRRTIRCT
jgi:RimJ/RimL family protein N-acetyltransferase